ncbi:MAG: hypothetical protein ACM3TU_03210 [Bacillota bacterium]
MWQDYLLTVVQVFFCLTLIPMLFAREKPPLASSIPTALSLFLSSVVFFSLHLWLAAVSQAIVGIQWATLAYQRVREVERKTTPSKEN